MIRGYIKEWLTLYDKKYSANEVDPIAGFLIDLFIVVLLTTLVLAIIIRLSIGPLGSDHWWFNIGSSIIVAPYLLRYKYHFRNISSYIRNINKDGIKLKIHTALNSYRQAIRIMFTRGNEPFGVFSWIFLALVIFNINITIMGDYPKLWVTLAIIQAIIVPPLLHAYLINWYRSTDKGSFFTWMFEADLDEKPSKDSWLSPTDPKAVKKAKKKAKKRAKKNAKKKAEPNEYLLALKSLLDACGSLEDSTGKFWLFVSVVVLAWIPYLIIASFFGDSIILATVLTILTPVTYTRGPYVLTILLKYPKIIYAWLVAYAITKRGELDEYVSDRISKEQDESVVTKEEK